MSSVVLRCRRCRCYYPGGSKEDTELRTHVHQLCSECAKGALENPRRDLPIPLLCRVCSHMRKDYACKESNLDVYVTYQSDKCDFNMSIIGMIILAAVIIIGAVGYVVK